MAMLLHVCSEPHMGKGGKLMRAVPFLTVMHWIIKLFSKNSNSGYCKILQFMILETSKDLHAG